MKKYLILPVIVALSACGGGGSSSPTGITPVTPAPTVSITLSTPKATVSETVKISWTSTNATSCTGTDRFSGTQAISGSIDFKPDAGGQFKYTLSCTGTGGTGSNSQTLIVPIPVQKSSYLNAKNLNIAPFAMPIHPNNKPYLADPYSGQALGDFFQDGTLSMVFTTILANTNKPEDVNKLGAIYFFKKDTSGNWIDKTTQLLSDNTGCVWAGKLLVADFNGDKVPDVFLSCSGFDASPFPGEHPRILMSQLDGTYKNVLLPFNCNCANATAADVNGNGFSDLIIAHATESGAAFFNGVGGFAYGTGNVLYGHEGKASYLVNNKNGTFSFDSKRLPSSFAALYNSVKFELVDFDDNGKFDLFVAGSEDDSVCSSCAIHPSIYKNDGTNHYASQPLILPSAGGGYVNDPDMLFYNGKIYLLLHSTNYMADAIQVIDYQNLSHKIIYTHSGSYADSAFTWLPSIAPYNGKIVSVNSVFGVSVSL